MVQLTPPRIEMTIEIGGGRRIGVAEYGPAAGRPLLWFHGTPGGRRQIPESLRSRLPGDDVRLVVIERPGYGSSTPHAYPDVLGVVEDVEVLLDALAIDRFGVAALSGGGPYALAVAYRYPDRAVAASILGGVAPHGGPDPARGGLVHTLAPLGPVAGPLARPIGVVLQGLVAALAPVLGTHAVDLAAHLFPAGDRRVLGDPANKAMFLDDIVRTVRGGLSGPALDLRLFVRDWGFDLADVRVPVHFWHGDADPIVTIEQARRMAERVPDATFVVRPEESHLGGFAAAHEAVARVMEHWEEQES